MKVLRLPPEIIEQFVDGGADFPVVVYGAVVEGRVLAAGGLCWENGRCFAWLDVFADMSARTMTLFRQARRMLKMAKQLGETEVFVYRDEHPNSSKLLALLGFEFVEIFEPTAKEIWKCPV